MMIRNLLLLLTAPLVVSERFLQAEETVVNSTTPQLPATQKTLQRIERCNTFAVLRKNNEKMMPVIGKIVEGFFRESEVAEFDDIYQAAASEIDEFCEVEAKYDFDCFNMSTQAGDVESIWSLWDTNGNGRITKVEFEAAENGMDLDGDN